MNVYSGVCIVLLTIAVAMCLFWMIRRIIDSIRDSFKEPYKPGESYSVMNMYDIIVWLGALTWFVITFDKILSFFM